ncbi:AMP-binding protein [Zoogloea sp. LCSB751]|uniref:AMP-binding protein n=1 Tax=Zoogloea sp. LCSB751 TaxID=1965277 RepID=UPI0009A4F0A7|nr:AMP-binding protein [Zoogloea sp. LCSB751]
MQISRTDADRAGATPATLPGYLLEQARRRANAIALRQKRLGIWHERTWSVLADEVARAAAALEADGFGAGDVLALLGHPCAEAVILMLAAQWLGGVAAPLPVEAEADALAGMLRMLAPKVAHGEDQEQVDRLLAAGFDGVRLIFADGRGLHAYGEAALAAYPAWLAGGADRLVPPLSARAAGVAVRYAGPSDWDGADEDVLRHDDLVAGAAGLLRAARVGERDAAFAGRRFAPAGVVRYLLAPWLIGGFSINLAEGLDSRDRDRREIGPTLVVGAAHTYARLRARIAARLPAAGGRWGNWLVRALTPDGGGWLARLLVLSPLREVAGLARVRTAIVIGPPADDATVDFFRCLGIELQHWPDIAPAGREDGAPSPRISFELTVWGAT